MPDMPRMPAMPVPPGGLPPGIGPQTQASATPGVAGLPPSPGMGSLPAMPMPPPDAGLELRATGEKTNLFNYSCARYEVKQRGETMEIWATDQLVPFQIYLPAQPPAFGPPMIEYQWPGPLWAKKLFPLRAVLHGENGMERYRFEVQSITPRAL